MISSALRRCGTWQGACSLWDAKNPVGNLYTFLRNKYYGYYGRPVVAHGGTVRILPGFLTAFSAAELSEP